MKFLSKLKTLFIKDILIYFIRCIIEYEGINEFMKNITKLTSLSEISFECIIK